MFDSHEWNQVEGKGEIEDLTLLALSTCGFCKRAKQYLMDRGLAFRYLELDTIPPEEKADLKREFKTRFDRRPSFPSLVISEERFLIGFIKESWDEELG